MKVNAYAALEPKAALTPYTYELGELGAEQVDIKISHCGFCHSDLSMINNDWEASTYPIVPGHEIIGEVIGLGSATKGLQIGDKVGVGWNAASCMSCQTCMEGAHHLCADKESTIVGRHGGFADHVRTHWSWAIKLPEGIDLAKAGPLLCGGITVFNPIIMADVKPTDSVGVIGIGGLGHLAIKFLKSWGCEIIAFSSNPDKTQAILDMGATRVIDSTDPEQLASIQGKLKLVINTTNVTLNWDAYLNTIKPKGVLHTVGAVPQDMEIPARRLIEAERSVSGSPLGSPALTKTMLEFAVRHNIYPIVEEFAMSDVNQAIDHLKQGKARFRIVLTNENG